MNFYLLHHVLNIELGESEFKVINLNMIKNKINYWTYD